MACSFLDIVSAVLDVLKAVDAYRSGEPGMIVVWMGASATISAISGILAFYALNAWWSFGITLVLAVITIALAILTMQELTLPQRLWVHRSVFGQPNHNYYNSEPFGGDKPRSLPNDSAAADEWKDYQRRALNEEAQALGMLLSGITLEVNGIVPAIKNVDPLFPEWKGAQNKDAPEYSKPELMLNLFIPLTLDGTIKITAIRKKEQISTKKDDEIIIFNKKGEDIIYIDNLNKARKDEKFTKYPLGYKRSIVFEDEKYKISTVVFEVYSLSDIYIPIAKDIIKLESK